MSKRKPRVSKTCVICGREFETARLQQQTCASKDCLHECHIRQLRATYSVRHSEIQRRRQERRLVQTSKVTGVTFARMAEIAHAQDCGDIEVLRRSAATWTKAEHAYAKRRYAELHHVSTIGYAKEI